MSQCSDPAKCPDCNPKLRATRRIESERAVTGPVFNRLFALNKPGGVYLPVPLSQMPARTDPRATATRWCNSTSTCPTSR